MESVEQQIGRIKNKKKREQLKAIQNGYNAMVKEANDYVKNNPGSKIVWLTADKMEEMMRTGSTTAEDGTTYTNQEVAKNIYDKENSNGK